MRYHYQVMADKGEFKSPTSAELKRLGVDTSTWNEGKGWLPPDMWERLRQLDELPKGECTAKKYGDPTIEEVEEGETGEAVQRPKLKGGTSKQEEQIRTIIKSGSRFKKERVEEEKPVPTGRKWKGEHWDPTSKTWILKEGEWWDPRAQKWKPGKPRTEPFYWIFEFMWDPTKYEDPCPLGDFHEKVLIKMDSHNRLIIEIPRDHLKTTVFNVDYMVHFILERPEFAKMGILNVAWDPGLSETTFMDVTENLSQNEKILSFYGYVIDENRPKTQDKIYFTYQPVGAKFGLRCTSFKSGSITGSHPYLIILDDPQDEPFTEKLMTKFRTVVKKKLLPAVAKRGKIIVTGTIKGFSSANDGYIWLEKNPTWTILRLPAANAMPPMKDIIAEKRAKPKVDKDTGIPLIGSDGEPIVEVYYHVEVKNREKYKLLYPERYTIEDLVRKLLEMQDEGKSSDDFYAEYFLQPQNPRGKFFLKDRIRSMPPPGFVSISAFVEWCHTCHYKICLWIDPGGAKGHGITVVVGAKVLGKFYFLEIQVLRAGLPEVAKAVARLIVQYKIRTAACEGNFSQKQTYAEVITEFLRQYMDSCGWMDDYTPIVAKNNTGDKIQRIQTHISNMIGLDGTDFQLFINQDAQDFDFFDVQAKDFGPNVPVSRAHDFDILDGMASMAIHLFSGAQRAICVSQ